MSSRFALNRLITKGLLGVVKFQSCKVHRVGGEAPVDGGAQIGIL